MTHRLTSLLLMMSLLGLSACETWKTFHTGTFRGKTYEVEELVTKGFDVSRIDYAVKLDGQKRAVIDALTTNWGPPYADDLYGKAPRVYVDKQHAPYRNEPDNAVRHASTMLYLSPDRFDREAFDQYAALMQSEWPAIDRQHSRSEYNRFPHVIGLVYGESNEFVRTFRGRRDGKSYLIKVEPDGRIRYMDEGPSANDEYSGLSEKVQMPGKRIYVATGKEAGLSIAELNHYKDAAGKTPGDYFDLREKSTVSPKTPR